MVSPSYALGSVKPGIHAISRSKSSLHLRGPVDPFEPPGKPEPEPLKQRLLLGLRLGHVPQADRGTDAADGLGRQDDVAAFDLSRVWANS